MGKPRILSSLRRITSRVSRKVFKKSNRRKRKILADRASFSNWLKPEQIKEVRINDEVIGRGGYGKVCKGKIFFKDAPPKAAAIKIFHPEFKLSDKDAENYQLCIQRLAEAGVPIPKMGMVKIKKSNLRSSMILPDQWVLVSQLFYKKAKSRKGKFYSKMGDIAYSEIPKREFIDIVIRTLNAGYVPSDDYLAGLFKGKPSRENTQGVIPIDIDLLQSQVNSNEARKIYVFREALEYLGRFIKPSINASDIKRIRLSVNEEMRSIFDKTIEQANLHKP